MISLESKVRGVRLLSGLQFILLCFVFTVPGLSLVQAQWTTNGNNINNTNSGNVGIGTSSPSAKLEVKPTLSSSSSSESAVKFTPTINQSGTGSWTAFEINPTITTQGAANNRFLDFKLSGQSKIVSYTSDPIIGGTTLRLSNTDATAYAPDVVYLNGTRMMFGVGGLDFSTAMSPLPGAGLYPGYFSVNLAHMRMAYYNSLAVGELTAGSTSVLLRGQISDGANAVGAYIDNYNQLTISGAKIASFRNAGSEKAFIDKDGGAYFNGSVTVNGNIAAKYQDVAEWVDSSETLPAGSVVILDSSKSNQVIASRKAYDSRVAGVISIRPGVALGEEAPGRVLVATTGRVRVKVDATNGPIQIGDLLVTSDEEGFAMKSVPVEVGGIQLHRPGTLIGKALEPQAKGRGEILVLLSLQ